MSNSGLGKMPRLASVADPMRRKIFSAVEKIDMVQLKDCWAQIDRILPGAKLLEVVAEAEGLYRNADTQDEYLLLAEVSVADDSGERETISATISAREDANHEVKIESVFLNVPNMSSELRP